MANRSEVCQLIFRKTCEIGVFYWPMIICSCASEGRDVLPYNNVIPVRSHSHDFL